GQGPCPRTGPLLIERPVRGHQDQPRPRERPGPQIPGRRHTGALVFRPAGKLARTHQRLRSDGQSGRYSEKNRL
ncbi:MAG: hypothetical protein, partial [Olavius algarvensis Delta 4 endosymbiont]